MDEFKLVVTPSFSKIEKRFLKRHPDVQNKYKTILFLLQKSPYHKSLRLHKIHGFGRNDIYSVSITMQYRIIIAFMVQEKRIIPVQVGTHDEVYNK